MEPWFAFAWSLAQWAVLAARQAAPALAQLPPTCRDALAHTALVCAGATPAYYPPGWGPWCLSWGWFCLGALSGAAATAFLVWRAMPIRPTCRRHGEFPPTVACCSDARPVVCGRGACGVEGPSDTGRHFARGPSLQLTPRGDGGRCNALAATWPPATSLLYTGNSGPAAPASARPCRTQPGEQALSTWHPKSCCGQTRDNRRHMHKRRHGPSSSGPCGASGSRIGGHRQAAAQQGVANHIREAIQLHATLAWSGFLASCEHDHRPGERSPIATYPVEQRGPAARVLGPRKGPLLARGAADARVPSPRKGLRWHEV